VNDLESSSPVVAGQVFADLLLLGALACQAPAAVLSVPQPDGGWSTLSYGFDRRDGLNDGVFFEAFARRPDAVEIADMSAHPEVSRSPLSAPPHSLRWAYGIALRAPGGPVLGVYAVLDRWLRQLTRREQRAMQAIARQLNSHLSQLRRPPAAGVGDTQQLTAQPRGRRPLRRHRAHRHQLGRSRKAPQPAHHRRPPPLPQRRRSRTAAPPTVGNRPHPGAGPTGERLGRGDHARRRRVASACSGTGAGASCPHVRVPDGPPDPDASWRTSVAALARWCFRNRRIVVFGWLALLVAAVAISHAVGSQATNTFRLPHTDSQEAYNLLSSEFPAAAGDSDQIVVHAKGTTLEDPAIRAQVDAMLAKVRALPHVRSVTDPYATPGAISRDGTIGLATATLDRQAQSVPKAAVRAVIRTAQQGDGPNLQVVLGGAAIQNAQSVKTGNSEALGAIVALIVLWIAFGSVLAALMPLLTALLAIGTGTSLIALLTHVMHVATFADQLSILIGLGVGIDYALFIVSRHRSGVMAGRSYEDATVTAVNTSGRAVLFAGMTVCIALLGQFALGVSFLYGVAISASLTVLLTMLTSLTLLPAMLGFLGPKVLNRRERRAMAEGATLPQSSSGFWFRWARLVERRAPLLGAIGLLLILALALPLLTMRLGLADAGNDPPSSTTRQAYDLLSDGFGPGFNGPFQLAAALPTPGSQATFQQVVRAVADQPGVAFATTPRVSPNGRAAVALVYPTTSPQAPATAALLHHLRGHVIPETEGTSGLVVHIGGSTASAADFSHALSQKLPLFVGVVVLLAFLLLMVVFRSLVVPLTASVMNLLSVGAAFGVLNAVFEWGWGRSVFGLDRTGPVDVFVPVLLFSVLFGLSMDYEVFLVSRIHEEWTRRRDNRVAVTVGQAETGRVITAAATIMILVFASFILGGLRIIKEFGIGLSGAVLIDAFVLRTMLVPALMHLFGRANWWLPKPLDRLLPHVTVDVGELPEEELEPVLASSD
jgi:RND superfamily putative drug exporter